MTKEDIDASEAPLLDHLLELRTRLIYCVVGFIATFILSFFYSSNILSLLILPFKWGTGTDTGLISIKLLGRVPGEAEDRHVRRHVHFLPADCHAALPLCGAGTLQE